MSEIRQCIQRIISSESLCGCVKTPRRITSPIIRCLRDFQLIQFIVLLVTLVTLSISLYPKDMLTKMRGPRRYPFMASYCCCRLPKLPSVVTWPTWPPSWRGKFPREVPWSLEPRTSVDHRWPWWPYQTIRIHQTAALSSSTRRPENVQEKKRESK